MDREAQEQARRAALRAADLIVDRLYDGGRDGNAGDDPLTDLLGVSNQGGFRYLGPRENPRLVVLTTSLSDPDWPDALDQETGTFTYYGDNKKPGHELHSTPRFGNELLKMLFERAHGGTASRRTVPPILVFSSRGRGYYRDMRFLGMVAPGVEGVSSTEDLVAIWKSVNGLRFQNYRALFTVLNVAHVKRSWLDLLRSGTADDALEPLAWTLWKSLGTYDALKSQRVFGFRTREEQLPSSRHHTSLLKEIVSTFHDNPVRFERCAGRIAEMLLGNVTRLDVTQPVRDGGRDAIGIYRMGGGVSGIDLEFALEAKCYSPGNSVGVKEMSRLISRLRHRQFGVLVTTSYVGRQAYEEIKEDRHPIVVVSGSDIASILERNGLGQISDLTLWLKQF